jgi:hypothetical protein
VSRSRALSTLSLVATLVACGSRTGLRDLEGIGDAARDDDTGRFDARPIECPSRPTGWSAPVVVADGVGSYAMAAHPRCGTFVLTSDAKDRIDVATLDARGTFVHADLGETGHVVAAASTDDGLHVLFHDGAMLRYLVRRDGISSPSEIIDPEGLQRADVLVDASGAVHVVYTAINGPIGELRYTTRRSEWSEPELVDGRSSFEPTIALGAGGVVHVAYEYVASSSDHACVVSTRAVSSSSWTVLDLARLDGHWSSSPCNLRTTREGILHVAFGAYRDEGYVLRHATGSIGALRFETIDRASSFGTDPKAAALDSTGRFHVAYRALADGALTMAVVAPSPGEKPTLEKLPAATGAGGVLVAIDGADVTHVVFFRDGALEYTSH